MTGAEFRAIRETLGLSQDALGKVMGITPMGISNLETGQKQVTRVQEAFILHLLRDNSRQLPTGAIENTVELAEGEALYVAVIPSRELPHEITLRKIQEHKS